MYRVNWGPNFIRSRFPIVRKFAQFAHDTSASCTLCTVYYVPCRPHTLHKAYLALCTLHRAHCTQYSTLHTVHSALRALCTSCIVHCALCTLQHAALRPSHCKLCTLRTLHSVRSVPSAH